jgi:hypothetical protein
LGQFPLRLLFSPAAQVERGVRAEDKRPHDQTASSAWNASVELHGASAD